MLYFYVDVILNVEVNRQYYNMSVFKNFCSNFVVSVILDFCLKSWIFDKYKQSNQFCYLGVSIEWERMESLLDMRMIDVEKILMSGEIFGCICEKDFFFKVDLFE